MHKLRSAIIGCGKIAAVHAQALKNIELTEFVAVQSRSAVKAEEFGARFSVQPYTDIAAMIKREKVDVVVICTPHPAHAAPAITAFQLGAHVLVEKPLAITLADCDAMIAAAESANRKLGVVSQRRFYPPVERMKKAIDDGKIGRPMLGHVIMYGWRDEEYYKSDPWRGSWEKEGGGVLVN